MERDTRIVHMILTKDLIGKGVLGDPMREATQLYTLDGKLVVEFDPTIQEGRVTKFIEEL